MLATETGEDAQNIGAVESCTDSVRKVLTLPSKILAQISLALVAAMALSVVVDVILRNMNRSVNGLSEVGVLLMVTLTFLSLPYIALKKGHLSIPILFNKFSPQVQSAVSVANDALVLIALGVLVWRTGGYALEVQHEHFVTTMLSIPVYPFVWIITLGFVLSGFVVLTDLSTSLTKFARTAWWPGLAIIIPMVVIFTSSPVWMGWLGFSKELSGLFCIVIMLALLLLAMPIAYAILFGALGTMTYLTSWNAMLIQAASAPYTTVAVYFLLVIPLFLLMGSFCVFSGISRDLYSTAQTWLGRLPGSLAMATVAGGTMFGAVCGDSIATAAAMGRVSLGPMKEAGYEPGFSGACIAVAGTLGILIPPSIPMVVYAILTEASITDLFVAGIIPGVLVALMVMGTIFLSAKRNPAIAPLGKPTTLKQKLVSLKGTGGMLILFVLVIGGMYGGWFTPIEAGAIGTVGALVFAMARRSVTWKNVSDSLLDAALMSGMVLLILVSITFMNSAMSLSRIPFMIADLVAGLEVSRWVIFAGLMLLYILAGMIMNIFAAILITIPILLPLLVDMQFDLVWLGIIVVLLVMIGQVTPPVAIVVYAVSSIAPDIPMGSIFKRVIVLWISEALVIVLISAVPAIALFLPNLLK